jgi:hypothetical protein
MRPFKFIVSAALIASTATFAVPAISAPMINQANVAHALPSATENVQYYRGGHRGYGHRGYGGRGYGHRGGGIGAGALLGGLAAGAIIGGAIASSQNNAAAQQNAVGQQNYEYCSQRYRSYDPRSGTYLNNDGNRYPCP